ncbi:MAG: tRNA preQ1(34) S-adenosylmethionine ribosyltransferase-isomerase QueA [Candidatus Melainabacteria bacterium]|nr:tRNA preQ1(34) S-adenosylmethionine ribosyltransferase-isomerase QueA [Candidatus Melainabacteria bacterium]MBI3308082.1 tRNA preQ1(34) S-adenosylmethionine ribosyltransferase-isomerase QueA [Candidatus Melainabacteria bacterium]
MSSNEDIYKLSTYNYILPKELIAQYPSRKRDESRLLCYKKSDDSITHHIFKELPEQLNKGDVLVLNNTKVIPARFFATTDLGKKIEILLVRPTNPANLTWKILAKPKKHLTKAKTITIQATEKNLEIDIINDETIDLKHPDRLELILNQIGQIPLPPYIKRDNRQGTTDKSSDDFERYQTVFAKEEGAVAAPTAALHFTEELLNKLQEKGVEILYITLHVGPGTFLPVRTGDIREHKMMPENYFIDQTTWNQILKAKEEKRRIIACGTTTVRALEYANLISKYSGQTNLYLTPGFQFKIVDALITNFHLPQTTLLILVSAFLGWDKIKALYNEAIKNKYRFYSYGDAMFIS